MLYRLLTPLVLLLASAGCTTLRQEFPGHDPGVVWTAMVAVADTPDYGGDDERWVLKENRAYANEAERRIEIYRELVRTSDLEKVEPFTEHRTYRFQVNLEELNPPTVSFVSRGTGFPRHASEEGHRYLDDVAAILGEPPAPLGEMPAGGTTTPEVAVRDLLYGIFLRDEDAIRRVIIPHPGAEILWSAGGVGVLPPSLGDRLDRRIIRPARVDEVIEIDGRSVRVTQPWVDGDRRIIIAALAGEPLAPFIVERIEGRWRVDVSRMIRGAR